jgi:hypothetical protein
MARTWRANFFPRRRSQPLPVAVIREGGERRGLATAGGMVWAVQLNGPNYNDMAYFEILGNSY